MPYEDLFEIHALGILHDAVAVIVVNKNNEILITKRSMNKLLGGLWEVPGSHINFQKKESINIIGSKCLKKELNIDIEDFEFIGKFSYFFEAQDFIENEIVYVIACLYDGPIKPNSEEITDFKWINLDELKNQINSSDVCFWLQEGFKILYDDVKKWFYDKKLL